METYLTYLIIAIVVIVGGGSFIMARKAMGAHKGNVAKYLEENPDASKIFYSTGKIANPILPESIEVHSVNGELPLVFTEQGRTGFYVKPGNATLVISHTSSRPGVLHKSVTKSTGEVEQEVVVEGRKIYQLSFDKKEGWFKFAESASGL
jgi:hypothetical protein